MIPAAFRPLLDLPLYAHLATVRPDGAAQVNPMWFLFDGERVRFTHTTKRGKFRNLQQNPSMAFSVVDPENPLRYLEVRGRLTEVVPDPTGAFYVELAERYGMPDPQAPADSADRVVLVMSVEKTTKQGS
ncbi:PPOX class F420-dependent oxidoreductase [Schumannella sp. 10F1B-5-1]|nr:PPOX class F420-dependent oxidoreductase [Schumannella sp. 10F1B-5-1]